MPTRQKASRRVIAAILASSAAVTAANAAAQDDASANGAPEMTYEERAVVQGAQAEYPTPAPMIPPSVYRDEYAEPAYISEPQVQNAEYDTAQREPHYPRHARHALPPMHHSAEYPARQGVYPGHVMGAPVYFPQGGYPAGAAPYPAEFERDQLGRDEWLQECRARYDGERGRGGQRGQVIGGLIGAAAGGLIGNRVAGRGDRLGGTLIGAGVGGLAGAVAGSAIGRSSDRREVLDECEAYLSQYEAQWRQTRYGYGPVMLVPIMIPVEQRAVVREYVTEEWVEEEVMVRVPAKRVIHRTPASKPIKTVPVKIMPTKSIKGR